MAAASEEVRVLMNSLDMATVIEEIEKYPFIWNISLPEYKFKNMKVQLWFRICEKLIPKWKTFSKRLKMECVAEIRKKWRHIKDYYRRHLFQKTTNKTSQYMYYDQLSFLKPIMGKRDSSPEPEVIEEDDLSAYDSEYYDLNPEEASASSAAPETRTPAAGSSESTMYDFLKSLDSPTFIKVIKNHPIIWDNHPVYTTGTLYKMRAEEWTNICTELIPKWESISKEAQWKYIFQLKKKWGNIRHYYRKNILKIYEYSELLSFLKPLYADEINKSNNSEAVDEDTEFEAEYLEELDDMQSVNNFKVEPVDPIRVASEEAEPAPKKFRTEMCVTDTTPEDSSESRAEDADLMFFRSLLPDIKTLDHEQKLDFKLETMKLLKKIKSKQFNYLDS